MDIKRFENETDEQFFYRLCSNKNALCCTWTQLAEIFNAEFGKNYGESKYRKDWVSMTRDSNCVFGPNAGDNEFMRELYGLENEKKKIQTEKIELNRWLREHARNELIDEKIITAIKELPKMDFPEPIIVDDKNNCEAILCLGDAHYGAKFKIVGLHGEIINEYSSEVFEARMLDLLRQVCAIIKRIGIKKIRVYELGDFTDGVLRCSQLMKLEYGVIEGTIRYARIMADWLNILSRYCCVEFHMTFGNHSELRMLGQKKGTFKHENMGLVVEEFIKLSLEGNPNFVFKNNPTGYIYDNVAGVNVLGIHGECKDLASELDKLSSIYGQRIDILVAGHLHHFKSETIGFQKEIVRVPSIMGADEYAVSLRKVSDAGALMMFVEPGKGKTGEYIIKL